MAAEPEIHPTAIVYPGTKLGEGVKVLEHAVVGKQPALSPRSTARRDPLEPTEIGDGTIVSTGAVVFAGTKVGARVILGDQSCVRERVVVGDDVVIGRGSLVENDTTIGAMTKIQAEAYITAYSTLEEHVFIGMQVVTTNDNDVYLKLKTEKKETQREIDELASALRIQILMMKDLRSQLTTVTKKAAAARRRIRSRSGAIATSKGLAMT